jgi:pimeloyl-ACP methyl ester carboxylesterase
MTDNGEDRLSVSKQRPNTRTGAVRRRVVFVPSQLLTADFWAPLIAQLGNTIDAMVGDHSRHDSVKAMARSILADAHEQFVLVAHGMGGFIAFEMLRQQPDRIQKIVLISTQARNDSPAQTARRLNYLRLVEAGNFAQVAEERIPILVHPKRTANEPLLSLIRKMAYDTGAEAFLRQQHAIMNRPDSRPSLPRIACPTLIVFGKEDGVATLANQQEMLEAIPGARLEIVEECGHLIPLERTDLLADLLASWI